MTASNLDHLMTQLSDFSDFRDISQNTDGPRLNLNIREAQRQEIRSFLGKELYQAMQADYNTIPTDTFTAQRFTDLWFGGTFSIQGSNVLYNGLKPALIYYSYERFIFQNPLNVTRYGDRILEDNELSIHAEATKKFRVSADSMGLSYQNDAQQFLEEFTATYPEWNRPNRLNKETTGLKMFKVGKTIGR